LALNLNGLLLTDRLLELCSLLLAAYALLLLKDAVSSG